MELVYILHFSEPFEHAMHYVGRSTAWTILRRLRDHRKGKGANLTKHVVRAGIHLHVGGIWQIEGDAGKVERQLKRIAHASRYCELCTREPKHLKGCTPMSLALLEEEGEER
jgi:predicted GIY-YIG superfamily endonuclease